MLTIVIGKKVRLTKPKYIFIKWRRIKSRITNIRLSLSFLHWKKQNEFHLRFCDGHSEFIFFT